MNEAANALQMNGAAAALQTFVASGIVLTCVVLCGLAGLRIRLFRSILSFASLVTAALAAFAWCDGAGRLVGACGVPDGWSLVAGYAAVFGVVFVFMAAIIHVVVRADVMTYFSLLDHVGGTAVGVAAGIFLASVVRVGFAMTPVAAAARPSPEQLQVDVTPRVLRMVSWILSSDAKVRRAWLYGRATRWDRDQPAPPQATWLSEPYIDLNANDRFDDDEPFLDKDGNRRFSTAFGVADPMAGAATDVGVMDRYWLGNWRLVRVSGSHIGADDAADEAGQPEAAGPAAAAGPPSS